MDRLAENDKVRLLKVTQGNLNQGHLYIRGHDDFFPADCIGPSRKNPNRDGQIEIELDGLDKIIRTDIPTSKNTGKPRGMLRNRTFKQFFEHHSISAGDQLAMERVGQRNYRLSTLARNQSGHSAPTAAEFFAGIGLVRLALEKQGWKVVFANDIDEDKIEMYLHNWPNDPHLVPGDIHDLKADQIPTCDLFTASFPCNDLSIAGRWEGLDGKQSSAFWGFMKLVRDMGERKPRLILLENVVGFLMSHGGRDLEKALLKLNELGYAVDAMILNAKQWVPQSRARLFIVGKQTDNAERRSFPLVTDARPPALCRFIAAHQDICWDLAELPPLPKSTPKLADIVEDLPDDDPHWWNEKRTEYFMKQMSKRHRAEAQKMIEAKTITYATAFRRVRNKKSMAELRTDGIAGCLRTPRGGSGRQILFKAGRGQYQVRLLTARECARLQGVPDSYAIDVLLNKALFGFGDAVCVPVVEWVLANSISIFHTLAASSAGSGIST